MSRSICVLKSCKDPTRDCLRPRLLLGMSRPSQSPNVLSAMSEILRNGSCQEAACRPTRPGEREAAMPDAWSLVQRLSRGARSEVSIQTTNELIDEGQRWLEAGNHKELFPEVDAVFSALVKFKSLQERFHDQQTSITSLTTRLRREEETRDDSRRGALVESGLTRKVSGCHTHSRIRLNHVAE
ncbi:hypothetical protein BJV77DRAFT_262963 [Russula vinacea]|nr:hypothetical protein BJV77DRAFT_262963 [Russula vinacea]